MTEKQIEIINNFNENYFRLDPLFPQNNKCTLAEFMGKTKIEKEVFIKSWAVSQISELKKIKTNLQSSLDQINAKIALYEGGVNDFDFVEGK